MSEDKFIEHLKEAAKDYNQPPPTPRGAMWARIEARRSEERAVPNNVISVHRSRWTSLTKWASVAAAVLVIGFAIGRLSAPSDEQTRVTEAVNPAPTVTHPETGPRTTDDISRDRSEIYRLAAAPLMGKAELLLTQFQNDRQINNGDEGFSERAASLLVDTRLLLNSPAKDDATLRLLLGDLELVLAQIIRLASERENEKQWIDDNIENRSLLPRLRTGRTNDRFTI